MGGEKGSLVSVGGGRRRAFRAAPATQRRILLSPSLARLGPQAGPQAGSERQGLLHTGIESSACVPPRTGVCKASSPEELS